ncbi:MAG: hypothetical protein GY772_01830, partial [bacterium]|nr:hypothetical protein [bacterium]
YCGLMAGTTTHGGGLETKAAATHWDVRVLVVPADAAVRPHVYHAGGAHGTVALRYEDGHYDWLKPRGALPRWLADIADAPPRRPLYGGACDDDAHGPSTTPTCPPAPPCPSTTPGSALRCPPSTVTARRLSRKTPTCDAGSGLLDLSTPTVPSARVAAATGPPRAPLATPTPPATATATLTARRLAVRSAPLTFSAPTRGGHVRAVHNGRAPRPRLVAATPRGRATRQKGYGPSTVALTQRWVCPMCPTVTCGPKVIKLRQAHLRRRHPGTAAQHDLRPRGPRTQPAGTSPPPGVVAPPQWRCRLCDHVLYLDPACYPGIMARRYHHRAAHPGLPQPALPPFVGTVEAHWRPAHPDPPRACSRLTAQNCARAVLAR